jgi:hypothetical protein
MIFVGILLPKAAECLRLQKKFSREINSIPLVKRCLKKYFASRFPQIKSVTPAVLSHTINLSGGPRRVIGITDC